MPKIVNLTSKLTNERPSIQVGEKVYEVNDSMETILTFQELAQVGTKEAFVQAFSLALGEEVVEELQIIKMSLENVKVLMIGILAAARKIDYEEAEKSFRDF